MRVVFEVTDAIDFVSCRIYFSGKKLLSRTHSAYYILPSHLARLALYFFALKSFHFDRNTSSSYSSFSPFLLFSLLLILCVRLSLSSISLSPLPSHLLLLLIFLLEQYSLTTPAQGSQFPRPVQFSNPTSFILFLNYLLLIDHHATRKQCTSC